MERDMRPKRVVSSLLGLAAVLALSVVSVVPAQAATNATLGDLNAANPSSNKYAGCVASVLTGSGVTFGSAAALGSDLAALWPTLPAGVADTCKQAVDGNQPQVCINPTDPATCLAIGAATAATIADLAAGYPGNWKLVADGVGTGGYAQTPLASSGPSAPMATVTGTFTTPTSVCTTKDCTVPPPPGLWTDCGPTTCGAVTTMKVNIIGRTPNGENGVQGQLQAVDGFGNITVVSGMFGNTYWGYGCGTAECSFSPSLTWNCKDLFGAPANCGGQSLTVSFTFDSGAGGGCGCASPAPAIGQVSEILLTADALNSFQNPTVCAGTFDCMRYDDTRLSYLDGSARPTLVLNPASAPSAVIDLAASDLACLVGIDVGKGSAVSCLDVTGAFAPLLQTAHAPVVPAPPPTITAVASPSGAASGWERSPVTVTVTASDANGPGINTVSYSATGAQPAPETAVHGTSAQVTVSTDGTTTINAWATDMVGTASTAQTLSVKLDHSGPVLSCATPSAAWSAGDVSVACSASDATSGLADATEAQFSLSTSVAAGAETASAATNSVTVCDVAGNCATAGPVTGLKVDRLAPSIIVTAPAGSYTVGQVVKAAYTCTDGGSGVATCAGTLPSGSPIDTAAAGPHNFTVDATDAAGNHSKLVANYTVAAAPTPAPKPVCTDSETANHEGNHQNDCEKHAVAVRPVKEPRPIPTPKPTPTHKPVKHGPEGTGDQKGK